MFRALSSESMRASSESKKSERYQIQWTCMLKIHEKMNTLEHGGRIFYSSDHFSIKSSFSIQISWLCLLPSTCSMESQHICTFLENRSVYNPRSYVTLLNVSFTQTLFKRRLSELIKVQSLFDLDI